LLLDVEKATVSIRGFFDFSQQLEKRFCSNCLFLGLQTFMEYRNDPKHAPNLDHIDRDIAYTKRILVIINTAFATRTSSDRSQRRLEQLK
jgi:hypothetical protein